MDLPAEVKSVMSDLQEAITDMELTVEKLIAIPLSETHAQLTPLERAKNDTASVYAITSLYWAYMKTRGLDPKEHGIPKELDRVKEVMGRAKQISDKALAPKLNIPAAKRFIRGGLWEANECDTKAQKNEDWPTLNKKMRTDTSS